LALVDA
jgi:hypothetical protein